MNKRFFLGRYIDIQSPIHCIDARLKLMATLTLMFISLIIHTFISVLMLSGITLALIVLAKVPLKVLYRGLKPVLSIILFTSFLQLLVIQGGKIYLSLWFINVTSSGIQNALSTGLRLIFIVIISTLLTLTTRPLELADSIEFFMWPLNKWINVQLWALMFSVAIRFIPTLMMSLQKLMIAQRSRGVRFEQKGLVKRSKALVPILIPLFSSTYRRSIELGTAMTARGFDDSVKRTKYRQLMWKSTDTFGAVLFIIGIVVIMML